MYGKSVEEVRKQKEQNMRNRIALEKSRAAAAAAKRKQQESGLIYVPPAPRAAVPAPLAVPAPSAPRAAVPAPLAVPAPSAPRAAVPAPLAVSAPPAPLTVAQNSVQSAYDRGISEAALLSVILGFYESKSHMQHDYSATNKSYELEIYSLFKKVINTIRQKKVRDSKNKIKTNNEGDPILDDVENALIELRIKMPFYSHNLSVASDLLRRRGNQNIYEKEKYERQINKVIQIINHKLELAEYEKLIHSGGKRTRRNRKNKKSRKYTRRN